MSVGKSSRTPMKHALLNRIVGREVGAMPYLKKRGMGSSYAIYDLTAGDGTDDGFGGTSSPAILAKHHRYAAANDVRCKLLLNDKVEDYASKLALDFPAAEVRCSDGRKVMPHMGYDVVFVHNDPNHINDWALSGEFLASAPYFTTTLSTLGCNVGGLKRLPSIEREPWFANMRTLLMSMPQHHDAYLIALSGDASQWAYLLTGPMKWRGNYESDVAKAFAGWEGGHRARWWRQDAAGFEDLTRQLFLTSAERAA